MNGPTSRLDFVLEPFTVPPTADRGQPISLDGRARTGIEAAVRALGVATDYGPAVYRLRLAPELMRGVLAGELTMMQAVGGGIRGNVVDGSGQIVGQAAFDAASKGAVLAAAAFQIAAMVTAQYFLHQLNQRLAGIEKNISAITRWLRDSWSADLRGSLAKLHEIATSLASHELTAVETSAKVQLVEAIDHQCRQIDQAVTAELARLSADARDFRGEVILRPTSPTLAAKAATLAGWLTEFGQLAQQRLLTLYVRAAVLQVRTALPVSRSATSARVDALRAEIAPIVEAHRSFLNRLLAHIADLKGALTTERTDAEVRVPLRTQRRDIVLALADAVEQIEELLATIAGRLRDGEHAAGRDLCIEVDDDGKVISIRTLEVAA